MTVRIEVSNGLGRVVLDHPPLNILTRAVLCEIRDGFAGLAREPVLRAVLLSAYGNHFSAGADVGEHLPPTFERMIPEFLDTLGTIDTFPLPVVAAVQGRCLGGGFELALAADIIVAAESALFGQPEIHLGVAPPAACAWLPQQTARGVAAKLVYTGDPIGAADAVRAGLVTQVVPDESLEPSAVALAGRITRHSAATLRIAKRMMRGWPGDERSAALARVGQAYVTDLMRTADATEGLRAFLEKREAVWSHQ